MKRFSWALLPTLLLTGTLVSQSDRSLVAGGLDGARGTTGVVDPRPKTFDLIVDQAALHGTPEKLAMVAGGPGAMLVSGLPESPGALALKAEAEALEEAQENKNQHGMKPCVTDAKPPPANSEPSDATATPNVTSAANAAPTSMDDPRKPCVVPVNPYRRFLDTSTPLLLTPRQKGYLAFRDLVDPFNLLTVVGNSAVTIAIDSHTAYGPGMGGFGRNVGYSFLQDATGEFIGTFAICSLFHEDPHYHRMPTARPMRRVGHAISRTVVAQHDDGSPMPNYQSLLGYPISAEISNLYVPGVSGNAPSTVARILTGLATDPIGNLITEFLPDLARRVHIRVVFVQQIINQVARGGEQF